VFDPAPPATPAVELLPNRLIKLWPWQLGEIPATNKDFTRNGSRWDSPILYGRADLPDAVARACRLGGRRVFEWEGPGRLVPATCP
jgi:hypothetical protein